MNVPHIYRIADKAYSKLPDNQTILISGESGAGKTHATREIMKYIEKDQVNQDIKIKDATKTQI